MDFIALGASQVSLPTLLPLDGQAYSSFVIWFESLPVLGGFGPGIQFQIQFFKKTKFWFQFSFWFWKWIPIEIQFLGMMTETGGPTVGWPLVPIPINF
jgi:hypothetical protein